MFTAARATRAPANDRTRIPGRPGLWYSISAGTLKGWWVQEAPGHRVLRGAHAVLSYPVARAATVRIARPVAVLAGRRRRRRGTTTYAAGARVSVNARAAVDGVDRLRLAAGPYRGRWIASSSLTLTG